MVIAEPAQLGRDRLVVLGHHHDRQTEHECHYQIYTKHDSHPVDIFRVAAWYSRDPTGSIVLTSRDQRQVLLVALLIGRLMEHLDTSGLADNTIVIYALSASLDSHGAVRT